MFFLGLEGSLLIVRTYISSINEANKQFHFQPLIQSCNWFTCSVWHDLYCL